jgi:hypothetical protein
MNKRPSFSILLFFLLFVITTMNMAAQEKSHRYTKRQMRHQPVWIELMNDPTANYYLTLQAFKEFWKSRPLPKEPFEAKEAEQFERAVGLISGNETEEEREREERNATPAKREEANRYAAEVRAFKGWMMDIQPWVLSDGSIVPPQERQRIIDQQNAEQREQEKKSTH